MSDQPTSLIQMGFHIVGLATKPDRTVVQLLVLRIEDLRVAPVFVDRQRAESFAQSAARSLPESQVTMVWTLPYQPRPQLEKALKHAFNPGDIEFLYEDRDRSLFGTLVDSQGLP